MTRAKDISKIVTDANLSGTLDVTGAFTSQGIDDNADAVAITIDSSERVGIGTSSPDTNLDIERSSNDTGGIKVQNTNNSQGSAVAQVEISGGDNAYANLLLECNSTNHSIRQDGSGNLKFINATTERMRIDSSGNVGIGTTSPDTNLDVEGAGDCTISITAGSTSHDSKIDFVHGSTIDGGITYDHNGAYASEQMKFRAGNNGTHMTLTGDGNLLVGTTTARTGTNTLSLEAGNSLIWFQKQNTDLQTQVVFNRNTQGTSSIAGTIQTTGTTVHYNTSSDYRLKENISYDFDATTRLKQLKPARFNWIQDETDTTVDGFLAHEVQSVVPEAISGTHNEVDADGNPVYQGIDQSKLVPLLVKTIQELEARITALENGE